MSPHAASLAVARRVRPSLCLALLATASCLGPAQAPGPAGSMESRGTVLFEQRPADPALLEAQIERLRAEGAPAEELARLEEILALSRAFAATDGVRARVRPEEAQAVRDLLRLLSARLAREAAAALDSAAPPGPLKGIEEEALADPSEPSEQKGPSLEEELLAAAEAQDADALSRVLARMSQGDWDRLSLAALWQACRALSLERRYEEAAGHLSPRLKPLARQPSRAELWVSLGRWLLAAGRYDEAREALSRVLADYDTAADQVRRAEELLAALEAKTGERERRMLSRLVEAEAIVAYGSDFSRAADLAGEVRVEFPGTDLSRKAAELEKTIAERSAQRSQAELARLWERFGAGETLDEILARLEWLARRTPGEDLAAQLAKAREDFQAAEAERRVGRLRVRDEEIAARWEEAQTAEAEGRYEEAVALLRTLAETPRRQEALDRLATVIEKLAARRRREASELFEKALAETDPARRRLALEQVRALLEEFLKAFPQYAERGRVERDLALVAAEIARLPAPAQEPAPPEVQPEKAPPEEATSGQAAPVSR